MVNVKAIKEFYYDHNLEENNTFYDDVSYIQHVLCEVLTPQEKARARKAIKNGGFFTFGYDGLACCNSCSETNVKRFFKRNFDIEWEEQ